MNVSIVSACAAHAEVLSCLAGCVIMNIAGSTSKLCVSPSMTTRNTVLMNVRIMYDSTNEHNETAISVEPPDNRIGRATMLSVR